MNLPTSLPSIILVYLIQIFIKVIKHYRCHRSPLSIFPMPLLSRGNDYHEFGVYHSDPCVTKYVFIQRLCLVFSC